MSIPKCNPGDLVYELFNRTGRGKRRYTTHIGLVLYKSPPDRRIGNWDIVHILFDGEVLAFTEDELYELDQIP